MIRFLGELPRECYIAVSGGPDSMAVLDFLAHDGKRDITVLHVNHGTAFGNLEGMPVTGRYCDRNRIKWSNTFIDTQPESNKENYWREKRYEFFNKFTDKPLITCHTLDDCIETWFFGACHGTPKLIPYRRGHIIRPFLVTPKNELVRWCDDHGVPFAVDPSNSDPAYMRSLIRTEMVPTVLKVNPGISKVIKRKVEEDFAATETCAV
jgi:tRNA(Ile)-lysidine synthetase-like protein